MCNLCVLILISVSFFLRHFFDSNLNRTLLCASPLVNLTFALLFFPVFHCCNDLWSALTLFFCLALWIFSFSCNSAEIFWFWSLIGWFPTIPVGRRWQTFLTAMDRFVPIAPFLGLMRSCSRSWLPFSVLSMAFENRSYEDYHLPFLLVSPDYFNVTKCLYQWQPFHTTNSECVYFAVMALNKTRVHAWHGDERWTLLMWVPTTNKGVTMNSASFFKIK